MLLLVLHLRVLRPFHVLGTWRYTPDITLVHSATGGLAQGLLGLQALGGWAGEGVQGCLGMPGLTGSFYPKLTYL